MTTELKAFEITGFGYDGSTDKTDDRVLWVLAPDEESLIMAIAGCYAECWGELTQGHWLDEFQPVDITTFKPDFVLPEGKAALRAKLLTWAPKNA